MTAADRLGAIEGNNVAEDEVLEAQARALERLQLGDVEGTRTVLGEPGNPIAAQVVQADGWGVQLLHTAVERHDKAMCRLLLQYASCRHDSHVGVFVSPLRAALDAYVSCPDGSLKEATEVVLLLLADAVAVDTAVLCDDVIVQELLCKWVHKMGSTNDRREAQDTVAALCVAALQAQPALLRDMHVWSPQSHQVQLPAGDASAAVAKQRTAAHHTVPAGTALMWAIKHQWRTMARVLLTLRDDGHNWWRVQLCTTMADGVNKLLPLHYAAACACPVVTALILKVLELAWMHVPKSYCNRYCGHLLASFTIRDVLPDQLLLNFSELAVDFIKNVSLVPANQPYGVECVRRMEMDAMWTLLADQPEAIVTARAASPRDFRTAFLWTGVTHEDTLLPLALQERMRSAQQVAEQSKRAKRGCLMRSLRRAVSAVHAVGTFVLFTPVLLVHLFVTAFKAVAGSRERAQRETAQFVLPVRSGGAIELVSRCVRIADRLNDRDLFTSNVLQALVRVLWNEGQVQRALEKAGCWHFYMMLTLLLSQVPVDYNSESALLLMYISGVAQLARFLFFPWLLWFGDEARGIRHAMRAHRNCWAGLADYLGGDPWSYMAVLLNVSFMASTILSLWASSQDSVTESTGAAWTALESLTALLLWTKVLDFMRVHRSAGPMVRMLTATFGELRSFLVIVAVCGVAFANALYVINAKAFFLTCTDSSEEGKEACGNFDVPQSFLQQLKLTFKAMVAGADPADIVDGHEDSYDVIQPLLSILWVVMGLVIALGLLNLIVALLTDSYARLRANPTAEWTLERARVVSRRSEPSTLAKHPFLHVLVPQGSFDHVVFSEDMSLVTCNLKAGRVAPTLKEDGATSSSTAGSLPVC